MEAKGAPLPVATSAVGACLQLTHAIGRTERLEDIYEAALDALADGLNVARAAVLLFDPDGIMRFKAWRGLSDAYRAAVEGHTPWTPRSTGAEPIVVADVRQDASLAPYLPTMPRGTDRGDGVHPARGVGRRAREVHVVLQRAADALARGTAARAGHRGADGLRGRTDPGATGRARQSDERLRFALDAANMGTWDWDLATQSVRWSDNMERIHGLPAGTFDSTFQSYAAEIHPDDRDRVLASIQRALAGGCTARRGVSHRRTRRHGPLG